MPTCITAICSSTTKAGIVAVDFGIMGRLGMKERRFLAEILYGFITGNYTRVAEVHFEAGYVPRKHAVARIRPSACAPSASRSWTARQRDFHGTAVGQLFQDTEVFDMQTRPELLLLQKTMVVVEGVGRSLDPELEHVGRIRAGGEGVDGADLWRGRPVRGRGGRRGLRRLAFMGEIPKLLGQAERTAEALSAMAEDGLGSTITR